tara:strand:- start:1807 stop:2133 length:327 start_codon:yes stop_codon:yes gene_type:complete
MINGEDILVTRDSYDAVLNESYAKTQVLWFFASWCGHCQDMHAEWEKATRIGRLDATWHKVDCSGAGLPLAHHMRVQSFPTIVYLKAGQADEYKGEREASAFVDAAKK